MWAFGAVRPVTILRAVVEHGAEVLASLPGPPVAPGKVNIDQNAGSTND